MSKAAVFIDVYDWTDGSVHVTVRFPNGTKDKTPGILLGKILQEELFAVSDGQAKDVTGRISVGGSGSVEVSMTTGGRIRLPDYFGCEFTLPPNTKVRE